MPYLNCKAVEDCAAIVVIPLYVSEHQLRWLTVVTCDTTVFFTATAVSEECAVNNMPVVIEARDVVLVAHAEQVDERFDLVDTVPDVLFKCGARRSNTNAMFVQYRAVVDLMDVETPFGDVERSGQALSLGQHLDCLIHWP